MVSISTISYKVSIKRLYTECLNSHLQVYEIVKLGAVNLIVLLILENSKR